MSKYILTTFNKSKKFKFCGLEVFPGCNFAGVMKKIYLSLLSAAMLSAASCAKKPADHQPEYHELKSVNKLILSRAAISKTARKETSEWYKVGKRIAVYSYDSYLQTYINLGELSPEDLTFDDTARTVSVKLPPIQIESAGRDMELRLEYENIGLLRSELSSKERAQMKEQANEEYRREITENSELRQTLIVSGQQKARIYIESLFAARGYSASITFKK